MSKQNTLAFSAAIFMLLGCSDSPDEILPFSGSLLEGWEINQTTVDLEIIPRDLFFVDSEIGFVVGSGGGIYKTTDSGQSWDRQSSTTTLNLYSVHFINEDAGFVSGQRMNNCLDEDCGKGSVLLTTNDGGLSWKKKFFQDFVAIKSLHFFDESRGLALINTPDKPNSRDLFLAKTENGGEDWELLELAVKSIYGKFFCVDDVIYVAGEHQEIYKSTDFGNTWDTITTPIPVSKNVRNIYFYNESLGIIDGVTDIYKTSDGGLTWTTADWPFSALYLFHLASESEGFNLKPRYKYTGGDFPDFVGSQSFQTSDGMETWTDSMFNIPEIYPMGLSHFPQRGLGYVINSSSFYSIERK